MSHDRNEISLGMSHGKVVRYLEFYDGLSDADRTICERYSHLILREIFEADHVPSDAELADFWESILTAFSVPLADLPDGLVDYLTGAVPGSIDP